MGQWAEKRYSGKSSWMRQKNERGDSKVESNDSPEIPDRGELSDIPGLPLGVERDVLSASAIDLVGKNETVAQKSCSVFFSTTSITC